MLSFHVQQAIHAGSPTPERQRLLGLLDSCDSYDAYPYPYHYSAACDDTTIAISSYGSDVAGPSYVPLSHYETGWVPDYKNGGIRYVSQGHLEEVDENGAPLEIYEEDMYIPCPPAPRIDAWELAPWLDSPRVTSTRSSITLMEYPEMNSHYPDNYSSMDACTTTTCASDSPVDLFSSSYPNSKSSIFAAQQAMYPSDTPSTPSWPDAPHASHASRRRKSVASSTARQKAAPYPKESPRIPLTPKNVDYFDYAVDEVSQKIVLNTAEVSVQVQETIPKMYSFSTHWQAQELLGVNTRVVENCDEIVALLRQVDHVLRNVKLHRNPNASSHLRSLQRTLKRLASVSEYRSNTLDHATRIVEKLEEHSAKLVNLLNKLVHKPS